MTIETRAKPKASNDCIEVGMFVVGCVTVWRMESKTRRVEVELDLGKGRHRAAIPLDPRRIAGTRQPHPQRQ